MSKSSTGVDWARDSVGVARPTRRGILDHVGIVGPDRAPLYQLVIHKAGVQWITNKCKGRCLFRLKDMPSPWLSCKYAQGIRCWIM